MYLSVFYVVLNSHEAFYQIYFIIRQLKKAVEKQRG